MFPIIRVDANKAYAREQLGTKPKFWYQEHVNAPWFLFKAEERGTGEDWAEKLAAEFAELLGLPHVDYQLAHEIQSDVPGVICEKFTPETGALKHGNQLLTEQDATYTKAQRWTASGHTAEAVAGVMEWLAPPPDVWCHNLPDGIESALDVFVGYVMLDAWIANQDRHHQNWGALRIGDQLHLAPSYDHGAAMARSEPEDKRRQRLETKDRGYSVEAFATKARSAFFADPSQKKAMLTVDAWCAFAQLAPDAARIWQESLRQVTPEAVDGLIEQVPPKRMSPACREFTRRLLAANQGRILEQELP